MIEKTKLEVIYIGEIHHAKDDATKRLMNRNLIIGNTYIVETIQESGWYKGYYIINGIFYPPESFKINTIKEKYGLR